MKVTIHSLHFDADKKLLDFIDGKITKLSQISDEIISSDVVLRIENSETNENKVAEIKLKIPGANEIFAKKQSRTFEESIDSATNALRRQLRKTKEKQRTQKK